MEQTEQIEQEQIIKPPLRRKKVKKHKKRLFGTIIGLLVIVLVIYFGVQALFPKTVIVEPPSPDQEIVPVKVETTFQKTINEQFNEVKANSFDGQKDEATLAVRTFALNLFTLWGVGDANEYNGQEFIPEEYKDTFNKTMQNTLLFRYPKLIEIYGADNLPIVIEVNANLDDEGYASYRDTTRNDSYTFIVTMVYQSGDAEGTKNADSSKAQEIITKWVYSAEVTMFYYEDEVGDGHWYVSEIKDVVSNEMGNVEM